MVGGGRRLVPVHEGWGWTETFFRRIDKRLRRPLKGSTGGPMNWGTSTWNIKASVKFRYFFKEKIDSLQ